MCLASQRRSLFRCLHCQNCSGHDFFFQIRSCHNKVQFLIPHLDNGCAPTRWLCTRRFGKPTFRPSRRHKTCEKKNIVFGDCFTFSSTCIFCLLTLSLPHFFSLIFANNFFPSVGKHPSIFGNLTCKFPLLKQWPTAWPVQSVKKCTTWWNKNPKGIVPGQTGHKKHLQGVVYLYTLLVGHTETQKCCTCVFSWWNEKHLRCRFFLVFYLVKYRQPSECCEVYLLGGKRVCVRGLPDLVQRLWAESVCVVDLFTFLRCDVPEKKRAVLNGQDIYWTVGIFLQMAAGQVKGWQVDEMEHKPFGSDNFVEEQLAHDAEGVCANLRYGLWNRIFGEWFASCLLKQ